MKKLINSVLVLILGGLLFNSCKDSTVTTEKTISDSSVNVVNTEKIEYPYIIKNPDNWNQGTQQNTLAALTALKAWENKNIDEAMKYFGDSIDIAFDGLEKRVSNDVILSFKLRIAC